MLQSADGGQRSIVLHSSPILLVAVAAAAPHPWEPSEPGLRMHKVDLALTAVEVIRGTVPPGTPREAGVTIEQSEYADVLQMRPLPGVWSGLQLLPGSKWVLFCHGTDLPVARLVATCTAVIPADQVLPGLRTAVKAEAEDLTLDAVLMLAKPQAARLDRVFVDFLYARYGGVAMSSDPQFDRLMAFAELVPLQVGTRQAMLMGAYDMVSDHGDAAPERGRRLALAMFRTLQMPEAADLHANLVQTYLPNLLGIDSAQPPMTAAYVFKDQQPLQTAIKSALKGPLHGSEHTKLEAWLEK